jgi:hypothetical protein
MEGLLIDTKICNLMTALEKELKELEKRLNDLEKKRHSGPGPASRSAGFADRDKNGFNMEMELQQTYSDFSILKIRYMMENL